MVRHSALARRRGPRALAALSLALPTIGIASLSVASTADAQYFGRNKVQYEEFDFKTLRTPHFDVMFYEEARVPALDAARMVERWYDRLQPVMRHELDRSSMIFYADHPDFQQTNVGGGGFIGQGTGGFTEGLRDRVVIPFTGIYADNDHVIGHELVHVFQYDIDRAATTAGGGGINQLPLWLIEGMAEYLSVGRRDPHTAMWLRDAAVRDDVPTIKQLTTDPRYFPYRYGQALWAYVGGKWGDAVVVDVYRAAVRGGFEQGIRRVLGITTDSLSKEWAAAIKQSYLPVAQGRTLPRDAGAPVLRSGRRAGDMYLSPAISPDGRWVAFLGRENVFTIDLFVADANTGRIVHTLTSPNQDSHFDELSYINSAGSWSPDGKKLAFVVFADGDNELAIFDVERRRIERQIEIPRVGAIADAAWSPDGTRIAFSGQAGGLSDLYVHDLRTRETRRLMEDRYADLQPSWSPDGRTLAFATDRSSETSFGVLSYGPMRIGLVDVESGQVRLLPGFPGAKHINPQFAPDGRSVFVVSDREGISDVYRLPIDGGDARQVTRLATGVSGITTHSPAISVARGTGRLLFSVFENAGYAIHALEAAQTEGTPVPGATNATVAAGQVDTPTGAVPSATGTTDNRIVGAAGILPPPEAVRVSAVERYVNDPLTGLPSAAAVDTFPLTNYRPKLGLAYVGSPGVGVAVGGYNGVGAAGGVAAYWTDELGNRTIGSTVQVNGDWKDVGGQVFYQATKNRWNWLAGVGHIPYLTGIAALIDTTLTTGSGEIPAQILEQTLLRIYVEQAALGAQYPFSQTRRVEFSATANLVNYDFDVQRFLYVNGQFADEVRENPEGPPALKYGQASVAYVGDYSQFGFTSPVAGGRYRFELAPTVGDLRFQSVTADYRRYFWLRPVSLAFRGMHFGRYGSGAERREIGPLYLGQEQLIRGYAAESFDVSECTVVGNASGGCPEFDRLIGSRIGVANFELRIPLFGTEELGLINFPYLPTEISPFVDAGVAWSSGSSADFRFARNTTDRVPVFSYGISARMNLFGFAVLEAYYANPVQRPERGWHFGFNLAPGW